MLWLLPLSLLIITAYILMPILIRKIARAPSRTRNLVWQYFYTAAIMGLIYAFCDWEINPSLLIIIGIGGFNAFACYCHWRAVDINLSKTYLYTLVDDVTAITLGYFLLNEAVYLNFWLYLGIAICLGSALLFVGIKKESMAGGNENTRIFGWILLYSFIWGAATFSMRYFSLEGVSIVTYVFGWYSGSLLGALLIFVIAGQKERGDKLNWKQRLNVLPLALAICIALFFLYWLRSLTPVSVSQPILQVAEMLFPTLIGLWVFKEIKKVSLKEKLYYGLAVIGGLTINFSF